jgi:CRP/FNR family cyclic AMP-dependent transcriptional regulator
MDAAVIRVVEAYAAARIRSTSRTAHTARATMPLVDLLATHGTRRTFRKNRLLIQEGDPGDTVFIIVSGRLRVFTENEDGERVVLGHYGPGEYVGEMSLDGRPRSASVEAAEETVCAVVTRAQIEDFIAEHPAFAFELLAKVIARARAATLRVGQLVLNDAYGRLRHWLATHARPLPGGVQLVGPLPTHAALAAELDCSRWTVRRLLDDLVRGGYVEIDAARRELRVLKPLPARW